MTQVIIFSDTSRPGLWLRSVGPYSLASHIRSKGYSAEVIDFISAIPFDDFCKIVEKYCTLETLIVGISTTWLDTERFSTDLKKTFGGEEKQEQNFYDSIKHKKYYDSFAYALTTKNYQKFLKKIKEHAPNAKIILGGGRAIDFINDDFDHCVLGYSENQIIDLLENNVLTNKQIINHDIKAERGDYDFNLSQTIYQKNDCLLDDETLAIEIGRGCIFKCKYCSFPLIGKKKLSYIKDPKLLKEELLNNWNQHNIRRYIISDDTFNDSLDKLIQLADIVQTLPFKPQFWCFARLDLMTAKPEMINLFLDIGIKEVQFGVESFHLPSAKTIGKGMGPDTKKETLYKIKEAWKDEISVKCSFIIGLPYETTDSINEHYTWLAKEDCPIDAVGINPLFISQPDKWQSYRWNSEFDLNYEKYGYYFENPKHHFDWKKKDNTDINSFDDAYKLYKYWQEKVNKNNFVTTDAFYYCNTKKIPYSFDELFTDQIYNAKENYDWKTMYLDQVQEKYIQNKL